MLFTLRHKLTVGAPNVSLCATTKTGEQVEEIMAVNLQEVTNDVQWMDCVSVSTAGSTSVTSKLSLSESDI